MAFRLLIVFYITEFLLFRDKQAVFIDQGLLRVTTGRVLGFASLEVLAFVAVRGYAMI
jgi:hypothetical protein